MGFSKVILTKSLLKFWIDDYANLKCTLCGSDLVEGDEVDGYYPFHIEYNRCQSCKEKGLSYET